MQLTIISTLQLTIFRQVGRKAGKYTLVKIKGAEAQNHIAVILFIFMNNNVFF